MAISFLLPSSYCPSHCLPPPPTAAKPAPGIYAIQLEGTLINPALVRIVQRRAEANRVQAGAAEVEYFVAVPRAGQTTGGTSCRQFPSFDSSLLDSPRGGGLLRPAIESDCRGWAAPVARG